MKDFLSKMSTRQKLLIVIIVILLIIWVIVVANSGNKAGVTPKNQKEATQNTTAEALEAGKAGQLNITKVSLNSDSQKTSFEADVTNPTDSAIQAEAINIILKNSKGEEIVTLTGYLGSSIAAFETKHISTTMERNLTKEKITKIEYQIVSTLKDDSEPL